MPCLGAQLPKPKEPKLGTGRRPPAAGRSKLRPGRVARSSGLLAPAAAAPALELIAVRKTKEPRRGEPEAPVRQPREVGLGFFIK